MQTARFSPLQTNCSGPSILTYIVVFEGIRHRSFMHLHVYNPILITQQVERFPNQFYIFFIIILHFWSKKVLLKDNTFAFCLFITQKNYFSIINSISQYFQFQIFVEIIIFESGATDILNSEGATKKIESLYRTVRTLS